MFKYLNGKIKRWLVKLKKLKGTPRSVATGVACGVAVSFTPFVGFHFMLASVMAWMMRGNIIAALLGTIAGNPWTFPFIWVSVLYTGKKFLGDGYNGIVDVNFAEVFTKAFNAIINLDFSAFMSDIWPIIYPMIVGCIPYVLISWWLSYLMIKSFLEKRRKRILQSEA